MLAALVKHMMVFALCAVVFFGCQKKNNTDDTGQFVPHPVIKEHQEVNTLAIGSKAPFFKLPDSNGKFVTIDDFNHADILVVIFTCSHCPTAQAYEDRIIKFTSDYANKGVQVVAIMPNSSAGLLLDECDYSDLDDSYANMRIRAKAKGFNFPFLYDGDDQNVTIQYGPMSTPHAFVFDKGRVLRYSGRLDDKEKPGTGNAEDLRRAVDEVLAGKQVSVPTTKTFGCSIKWSWKSEWAEKVNQDWIQKPVSLEPIEGQGLKTLLSNKSDKLLLINIWASWCAPCVMELPELIKLQRMYGTKRKFEFVTISMDNPDKKNEVLDLLRKDHIAVRNYLYTNDDRDKMINMVDPTWTGSLPYTLLIEPGGKIIYKNQGLVDLLPLKRTIVEHPLLGRYY